MSKIIGLVAMGQSPTDVTPFLRPLFKPETQLLEQGILDGLSRSEIDALAPKAGVPPVITTLADGGTVTVARPLLEPLILKTIRDLKLQGADATIILCTGHFADIVLPPGILTVFPHRVIDGYIGALNHPDFRLGVLVPLPEQEENAFNKYRALGISAVTGNANPYGNVDYRKAAEKFQDVDVVVLHCMGFTGEQRSLVQEGCGRPVIQANVFVGGTVAAMLNA